MKLAIVGTRHALTPERLQIIYARMRLIPPRDIVVTGCCPTGVDEAVRKFATGRWLLVVFHAHWELVGHGAGPLRNDAIADYADACVAYPDKVSRGTRQCINAFMAIGKAVDVVEPS